MKRSKGTAAFTNQAKNFTFFVPLRLRVSSLDRSISKISVNYVYHWVRTKKHMILSAEALGHGMKNWRTGPTHRYYKAVYNN